MNRWWNGIRLNERKYDKSMLWITITSLRKPEKSEPLKYPFESGSVHKALTKPRTPRMEISVTAK